jgi:UDP-N-acetylmuramoyl-L-alanyl-D-glutamate--2,6-diaminopimelate ligase
MERLALKNADFDVIIDYAHTERALRLLLETVRCCMKEAEGRLLLLFGCGGERDRSKRATMGRCAEELADFTIVTSDNSRHEDPKQIIREILVGMQLRSKRRVILRRERAIDYAVSIARKGDVLLLVGKGHETYEAIGGTLRPFDERKIVTRALEKREKAHTISDAIEGMNA